MPPIYSGSTPITKMYLGGTQLSAVYLGVQSLLGSAPGSAVLRMAASANAQQLTANYSSCEQKPFDYAFTGLKITLINNSTADVVLDGVVVAAAPTDLHNGVGLSWIQATKNGSTTITIPARTDGEGDTTVNRIPGMVQLDLLPISSVARTDTPGDPYLIQLRAHSAGVLATNGGPVTRANGSVVYLFNRGYKFGWQQTVNGNAVASPSTTSVTLSGASAIGMIGHIEGVTENPLHFSLPCFGDSLTAGYSGTADASQCGWPNMVVFAMRSSTKVGGLANYAVGGMRQNTIYNVMRRYVSTHKPKAVYFPAFSPNTGTSTQGIWDAQFAEFEIVLAEMVAQGIKCFVANALPLNNMTTPQKAMMVAFNASVAAEVATYASNQAHLLDFYTVINDPASPGNMIAAYNYDNIHQTPLGQQAIADYVAAQLGL